ncbi:unnamed protein product [Lymnaea stagnalis]|uniref:G-protein coupled receptors family 1 profile domain-containing protein n=1 Tax=Lymnaea stagnalis TaxID=6523 RepID=A0AAV2ICQ6_LYMST
MLPPMNETDEFIDGSGAGGPMCDHEPEGGPGNMTTLEANITHFALPAVCVFGIVGNLLNLAILTRRKLQKSFRTLEQAANVCLISLAVSDLMFCVFAFLTMFIPADKIFLDQGILFNYARYSYAIINVFIMESTMLTVAMSLERFMAICYPLRQDLYLTTRRIKYIIVFTFIFSVGFNVPVLWRFKAVTWCPTNTSTITNGADLMTSHKNMVPLHNSKAVETAYRVAWAILGNYIPLVLLVYFNVCLCRKIYRSYKLRKHLGRQDQTRSSSHILTITLVAIVVLFFILVAPSETILQVMQMTESPTTSSFEAVLNLMQAINFSVNFILYCIISPYFRKTLKYMVLCGCYNIYQVSRDWKKEFETSLM